MDNTIAQKFGGRLRVRVCGIYIENERLLLINHFGLYGHDFWAPPGGGVELGESVTNALVREFKEECNSEINVGEFLFGCEVIKPPLHAVELFFGVDLKNVPKLGIDPEMADRQLISALDYLTASDLKKIPEKNKHSILSRIEKPPELYRLKGFFNFT